MTGLFLGVDAGNTKTIAAVADRTGVVLGWALGGLGDIYGVVDPREATSEVLRLVDQALAAARTSDPEIAAAKITAAAFRLAGIDWPEDEELWTEVLRTHLGTGTKISIKNDGFALLRCGDPDGVGVAVSLGTAAAIAGRGRDGSELALCWWIQDPLGGSGLVHDALRAIYQAELGLAPETTLSKEIPFFFGVASTEELLHQFTRREQPRGSFPERSTAAPIVLAEAAAGDPVAAGIVDHHARRVADYVSACAAKVGLRADEPFAVTLGGSVAAKDELLRRTVIRELIKELPRAEVVTRDAIPILGTVLDALAEGGAEPSPAERDNLRRWEHGL